MSFEAFAGGKRKSPEKFGGGQSFSPRALQLGYHQYAFPAGDAQIARIRAKDLTRRPPSRSGGATPDFELHPPDARIRARRMIERPNPAIHRHRILSPIDASLALVERRC